MSDVLADLDEDVMAMPAGAGASGAPITTAAAERRKGRGGKDDDMEVEDRYAGKAGIFDSLKSDGAGPLKCERLHPARPSPACHLPAPPHPSSTTTRAPRPH